MQFSTPRYTDKIWEEIYYGHKEVFQLVIAEMNDANFKALVARAHRRDQKTKGGKQIDKLYAACIMLAVIDEAPRYEIEENFDVEREEYSRSKGTQ